MDIESQMSKPSNPYDSEGKYIIKLRTLSNSIDYLIFIHRYSSVVLALACNFCGTGFERWQGK